MAVQFSADLCLLNGLLPVSSVFYLSFQFLNFAFINVCLYTVQASVFGHPFSWLTRGLLLNTLLTPLVPFILLTWPNQCNQLILTNESMWCGYKITGLMSEHFYSNNYTIEMLSPSLYSPPRSLHHSMRIFHCWKQCCRPSSDSLFMSSVAFAFTASADSNLVLFNVDLFFGN